MSLTIPQKIELLKTIAEDGEIICEDYLTKLFETKPNPHAYNGFEPSGQCHLATGFVTANNVNILLRAGCRVTIWIADIFAMINNKYGGDQTKIMNCGKYMIEVWKSCGMDTENPNLNFIWASDHVFTQDYMLPLFQKSTQSTITRLLRCGTIMGRKDSRNQPLSFALYPLMQAHDAEYLDVDIIQMGLDQRKACVLVNERESGEELKTVTILHKLLPGLKLNQEKMSKSDPSSSIYMTDDEATVNQKIKTAYCAEGNMTYNPILEYVKYIIFPYLRSNDSQFILTRPERFGGNVTYETFNDLSTAFENKEVHPGDLKTVVANYLNEMLIPVRNHFANDEEAREVLEAVQGY